MRDEGQLGRYRARFADTDEDLRRAQALRYRAFREKGGADEARVQSDEDAFDAHCRHILVEETQSGTLVCCFRLLHLLDGQEVTRSYSAQFYDLAALQAFQGPMAEMGRFCIHPDWHDPDILRIAWGAMTGFVDEMGVEMLFGCSSFHGVQAQDYWDAFALLRARHLAPAHWSPQVKSGDVFEFASLAGHRPDLKRAQANMPPLLRTYLLMGGWVSDHAVIDRDMNTLHVFTGLEIAAVPPARARLLRNLAASR